MKEAFGGKATKQIVLIFQKQSAATHQILFWNAINTWGEKLPTDNNYL